MKLTRKNFEIIVLLHNIRSVHNVASIFRTADAAGVKKIYLCGITPGPLDRFGKVLPQFAKVSLGAEKSMQWDGSASSSAMSSGPNGSPRAISKLLESLKNDGYKIMAVEQSKESVPYYCVMRQASSVKKIALVMGNEVRGLPASILKKSDKILEIPMKGKKESLNVSVAFGIIVYNLLLSL